ncbi:MAG: ABC transporter permease, partial [Rudaea sp.]
ALVIFFTISTKLTNNIDFLTMRTVWGITEYATQVLICALGQTLVIISAGIDLSIGWTLGLAAVVDALVMREMNAAGYPPLATYLAGAFAAVIVCGAAGWGNGWLVARVKVPPFIATLGMAGIVTGAAYILSTGIPVADQPVWLGQLGNGYLAWFWPGHGFFFFNIPPEVTPDQLREMIPLMPNIVLVAIITVATMWFLLAQTQFGQHIYAIGNNIDAAIRAGIPVRRTLIWVYTLAGLLAGIAGIIWAARFTSGAANAGQTTTMDTVAAVVIGGASLFGGEGRIMGTVVGALLIATIQFGLVMLNVSPFYQYVAVGGVVIVAVIVDQFGKTLGK